MKKKLFRRSVWTLLSIFFVLIFIIAILLGQIAAQYSSWIDTYFGATRHKLVNVGDTAEKDTQYYVSDYAVKDENGELVLTADANGVYHQSYDNAAMRAHSIEVAEEVGEEGAVLLWNNGALPLANGTKVAAFGVNFLDWLFIGGGSGHIDVAPASPIRDVLTDRGLTVNSDVWTANMLAKSGVSRQNDWNYAVGGSYFNEVSIKETSWTKLNSTRKGDLTACLDGDTALYSISRSGSEDGDTNFVSSEVENGDYLDLSVEEISILEGLRGLKQQGKIQNVILIVNTACPLSMRTVSEYGIDACLWVGMGGEAAFGYLADLLVGNANPSGRLPDTWVKDVKSAPAYENFGDFTFTESTGVPETAQHAHNTKYVVYQEGIYVGYRYYETRYEDLVMKRGNADSSKGVRMGESKWDYSAEVAYPFGHGESYTTFEKSAFSVRKDGSDYIVSVTVKNTGSVAGKDVVQVYLQKPYTQYDEAHKLEKAAVELVGYAKTGLIAAGESETVTVTVPEYEFKSYDAYGQKTYILEAGDYYLSVGENAHDALNNILAAKGCTKSDGMDEDGNVGFVQKQTYAQNDYETYSVSPAGYAVTNRFDDADINLYEGTKGQEIVYLSRSDWNGTYPSAVSLACTGEKMVADMQYGGTGITEDSDAEMPLYNTVTSEYGKLSLIQLKGLPYDNELWDDLLNQLTWEETNLLVTRGAGSITGASSVSAPGFKSSDGPVGTNGMAFPCNPIVAATFNPELEEKMGVAFGMEVMQAGRTGIFGPAANIHRCAYGGRTFEYYSEDGFLSGKANAAVTRGLQSKGIVVFTKHFALNDQERNRYGTTTWANEQAIREVYLKAFEAGVTEGAARGIMTSFNRIGCTWAGNHAGLMNGVLKGEWGFTGMAETDAVGEACPYMSDPVSYAKGVAAGQDVWMGGGSETMFDAYKTNATVCTAMREAAHRVLYNQLQSSAMNGMSSSTRVVEVMPGWEMAILALEIVSAILAGACIAMVAVSWVVWKKRKED